MTTQNIPVSQFPVAIGLDGTEEVPIVQGGVTKRTTTQAIGDLATDSVPATRRINTDADSGLAGGGSLASDLYLTLDAANLNAKTTPVVADSIVINDSSDGNTLSTTFANSYKTIVGLPPLSFPNATSDYFVIYHAADGTPYKITPSALSLITGNVPTGGIAGQFLIKQSSTDYDSAWSGTATTFTFGTQQTTQGSVVLANTAAGSFSTTLKSSNSSSAGWTFTFPVTAGTSGYFLTTNGSGVTSWSNPVTSTTLTANSTPTSGFTAGQLLYSDGSLLQAAGAAKATSLALGGATIGGDSLGVTGTSTFSSTVTGGTFVPTLNSIPTDGMYLNAAGQVAFAAGSTRIFFINSAGLLMANAAGSTLVAGAATAIAPTVVPRRSDSATGMGSAGTASLSLIATSIEQLRVNNGSIYVGGAASGSNAVAVAPTVSAALSTGTATNPDLVFQTGVKTTTGSTQATATTALTIKGETQAATFANAVTLGTQQTTQGSLVLANTAAGAFSTTLQSSNSASAAWTMTLPVTAGTSGYALTTNGSGVTSWTSAALVATLTANSTLTSGFTAGQLLYSDGTKLQAAGAVIATSLALGGASIGSNALAVTGTSALNPAAANASILTSAGGSNTGSNTTAAVDLSWTINTSGSPDVFALRVTDTARGAATSLFSLFSGASGTTRNLAVDRSGFVYSSGFAAGGAASFSSSNVTAAINYSGLGYLELISGGRISFGSSSTSAPTGDTFLTRGGAAATLQHGAADVNGAPVAQIIKFQSPLAGSATNTAGANATIIGSLGTGTGTGGDIIFQTNVKTTTGTAQGTATTALTIKGETLQTISASPVSITVPGIAFSAMSGPSGMSAVGTGSIGLIYNSVQKQTFWNDGSIYLLGTSPALHGGTGMTFDWNTDTGFARISAGVVGITLGSTGAGGSLNLTNLTATGVFATGANSGTGGQLTLNGATSGSGVLKVAAAAGSAIVFQLPSANGSNGNVLSTDGAGVTSWISVGGTGTVTSITAGTGLTGGTITGSGTVALDLTRANTWTGSPTFSTVPVNISGNFSASAWTTSGTRLVIAPASYTDSSSSGTVATAYTDLFGVSTILASSSTTYTNYFGSYFKDPVASTNVTMTNKWSLGADSMRVGTSNPLTISTSGVLTATSPTFTTPVLGTPSSGTLTNCTGLPVAGGGTGVATLTAYAVICGGTTTTGAVQSIASVGSSGNVLTSNGAGALPTFQAAVASGLQSATGSFSKNMADATAGTTTISGLAFQPTAIQFFATFVTSNTLIISNGAVDSSKAGRSVMSFPSDGVGAPVTSTGAFAIAVSNSSTLAAFQTAIVTTYNSDGALLTWTKTGSPTGSVTVNWIAFR